MLLHELAEALLSSNQNTYLANTRRAYASDLGLLAQLYPDLDARDVTVQHLRAFLNAMADLSPSTLSAGRPRSALASDGPTVMRSLTLTLRDGWSLLRSRSETHGP